MSEIDTVLRANIAYAADNPDVPGKNPGRGLAVVACMDTRLDLPAALGVMVRASHRLTAGQVRRPSY